MVTNVKLAILTLLLCILLAMPANAYDFTLSVYGNANMDDIIDEDDIEYLQGIIDGDYEETKFADANYDGLIDEEDLVQIESIISGDKVKLTLIDNNDVTVTLNTPVDRVATLFHGALRPVIHLGSIDRIEGIGSSILNMPYEVLILHAHPELRYLPEIGTTADPSQEAIISLGLDVVLGTSHTDKETSQAVSQNTGIPFVYAGPSLLGKFGTNDGAFETWRTMGLILGSEEQKRAEELISYCDEKINDIVGITSEIPEEDKPRVYLISCCNPELTITADFYEPIEIAGGINVAERIVANNWWGGVDISKEQIIDWDPEIILIQSYTEDNWVTVDEVLSDPTLKTVSAIKNKRVYNTKAWYAGWDPATGLCECVYLARVFQPEKFEDVDVELECNKILEEFYGIDDLYSWVQDYCNLQTWS